MAGGTSHTQTPIPQLTKLNYDTWNIKMKTWLKAEETWEMVRDGFTELENLGALSQAQQNKLKDERKRDNRALSDLQNAIEDSFFEKIAGAETSKEAWDILFKTFKVADRVNQVRLQTLRGEMESMTMKETESVSDYITRVEQITNQLKNNGEEITEARIVEKILRFLTGKFENIVCAIEESKNLSEMKVDQEEQLKEKSVIPVANLGTSQRDVGITKKMKNVKIW